MGVATHFPPQPFSNLTSSAPSPFSSSHSWLLIQSQPPTFSRSAQISPPFPILPFLCPCPKLLTRLQALAPIFPIFKPNKLSLLATTSQKKRDMERPGKTGPKATVARSCNYTVQKEGRPAQTDSPRYLAHSCGRELQSMC